MKGNTVYIGSLWALALSLLPATGMQAGDSSKERIVINDHKTAKLEFKQSREITLDQNNVFVAGAKRKTKTAVALYETQHAVMLFETETTGVPPHRVSQLPSAYYCYELRSITPGVDYSWTVWNGLGQLYGFRLFTDADETTRLAWMDGGFVRVADVSKPVTRQAALRKVFAPKKTPSYEIVALGDLRPFLGTTSAVRLDINIESVGKDKSGNLTVKVANSKGDEFAFVKKDGTWRAK